MKLSIPNPCSEDWAKMSPIEKGRHCAVCDHEVVDFTHFSDKKLVSFLDAQTGKVCGRISAQQLNRNLFIPEYESRNLLKRAAAVLALLGGASIGFAQEVPDTVVVQKEIINKDSSSKISNFNALGKTIIEGIILNELNNPVMFSDVRVYDKFDNLIGRYQTGENGRYKVCISDSINNLRITVFKIGYHEESSNFKVENGRLEYNCKLYKSEEMMVIGQVVGVKRKKRKCVRKPRNKKSQK